MTDISLKQTAKQCLSETPDMSVLTNVFGYGRGAPEKLSVKRQLELVQGQSFGINIIVVCPGSFSSADYRKIEEAVQVARDLFAQRDIGLRGVERYHVESGDANGHCVLGDDGSSNSEAQALTQDWTVDNDFMDAFLVRTITGSTAGWSAVDGQCDKQSAGCEMSGSVFEVLNNSTVMGIILAHELGHYFGLEHNSSTNNFMNASVGPSNTNITNGQANTIKGKDCFTTEVC